MSESFLSQEEVDALLEGRATGREGDEQHEGLAQGNDTQDPCLTQNVCHIRRVVKARFEDQDHRSHKRDIGGP